ncbi:MAG: response regulator transcription factor [Bacteroidales bacterium]|nr:response regulator transcription factor [Bacteroidales bacterium]MBN2758270.1 response regulator transcription factor [Bacteroidales bacterium]
MKPACSYVIIDDDDFARETLIDLLDKIPGFHLLKSLSESGLAIKHLATLKPDIVFLDVNMPNKTGIDVQKEIMDLQLSSKVIFTTAHEEYVVEAFKNKAFDYLIKPICKKELYETLNRFYCLNNYSEPISTENNVTQLAKPFNEIIIKNAYGTLILQNDDVVYIEADGTYTNIYQMHGKTEVISKNIGKIEQLFTKLHFYKISRTHIINLKYLKKTDRLNKKVTLSFNNQNIQLKVSRERFYDLEQRLQSKIYK